MRYGHGRGPGQGSGSGQGRGAARGTDRWSAVLALLLTGAGVTWQTYLHSAGGAHERHELPLAVHALRDGTLALPLVLVAVLLAVPAARALAAAAAATATALWATLTGAVAAATALALAAGQPVHERLFGSGAHPGPVWYLHLPRDASVTFAVLVPVAGILVACAPRPWLNPTAAARAAVPVDLPLAAPQDTRSDALPGPLAAPRPRRRLSARAAVVTAALVASALSAAGLPTASPAAAATGVCATAVRTIHYDISAIQLDLPLNGWGDHVPDGLMYALRNADAHPNAAELVAEPGLAAPIAMRAAVGDCIVVRLRNEITGLRVGMHVDGVAKDVSDSDGAYVGRNPDTTAAPGQERTYTWYAQREGQFAINDYGSGTDFNRVDPTTDTTSRGLYGGLIVLPAGSSWHDPITGSDLLAGTDQHAVGAPLYADVHVPGVGNDFRDYAQIFMDEPEGIVDATGQAPTFPTTGLRDASFGFNYRTEPLRNRLRAVLQHRAGRTVTLPNGTVILPQDHFCDGWTTDQDAATNTARLARDQGLSSCLGEESHLQAWAFGDAGRLTRATDETDVLTVTGDPGDSFTLTVQDPTLTGPLTPAGAVDLGAARFAGERTTTGPIPVGATAADVEAAVLALTPLPMADLAAGDVTVTGADGRFVLSFGQHFAGRDVQVSVTAPASGTATVSDAVADGGRPGRIETLSDNLLPKAYRGDPLHMRLIHPGVKETHPFHQHTNRWRQEPNDDRSTRLDVQSIGPGQTFDLVYEGGAGEAITEDPANPAAGARSMEEWVRAGRPDLALLAISRSSNGDQVFHCHLYPHFAQGFWGALRVFDRQRPADPALWPAGTPRTYPDATPLEPLQTLPDFDFAVNGHRATELPDAAHPGYPLMLKGEYLQRAYRAPGAVVADRYGAPALNWRRPGDTVRDYGSAVTTDLERANMVTRTDPAGVRHAVPGAFFIDPCPTGAPSRQYHPTAIDAKIVYNSKGWNDPDGKLYVEAPPSDPTDPSTSLDVADAIRRRINAGTWQPEPYNIRARLGECVDMRTTNATNLDNDPALPLDIHDGQISATGALTGGNAFHAPTPMSELSTHVHLVRFDELATDGTSIGWNYVQAPMVGQTWNYRWFTDVALRTVYFHDHQNPNTHQQHGLWAAMNVEPNGATFNDSGSGTLLTPSYCAGLGLPAAVQAGSTVPACYGVGSVSDIRVPTDPVTGINGSFREFTVNYSDFVPLYDAAGKPLNPPGAPDEYAADQGGMAINYRNEPFPTRINSQSTGDRAEPGWVFSSAVHGDPSTPLFRAYPHDPVVFRFMGGAHEEGHNFTVSGHRWLSEPDDPNSNLYDSQFVMIAEWFNMEVSGTNVVKRGSRNSAVERAREAGETEFGSTLVLPGGAGAPGDYLYGSLPLNDLWNGMWGIFRVQARRTADLQPLPSNPAPAATAATAFPALQPGGGIRTPRPGPGNPCPSGAPNRSYDLSVVQQRTVYNAAGDNDPSGLAYVLNKDLDGAGRPKSGTALKPLVIRAAEGECLNVTLTNRLPATGITLGDGDPINPVELIGTRGTSTVTNRLPDGSLQQVRPVWPAGNRASMHVSGLVRAFADRSDGAAVGYNYDSTVGPGGRLSYRYYVDTRKIGVVNLSDYGNLRTSRHHGLWGGLVVEPAGSTFLNPKDLTALPSGESAVIRYPDGRATRAYREFVVDFQDGLNLFDRNGIPIPDRVTPDVPGGAPDLEDQGERGVNYRSEPFANRIGTTGAAADVFSSTVFGDPATPVFQAYPNDPVMVRVLNSQDLPRVHTFGMTGHAWRYELSDPTSNVITGQGGLDTGRAFNAGVCAGSNTPLSFTGVQPVCAADGRPGDYLYNDRNLFHMLEGGIWGLVRVHAVAQADLKALPR